ncbi:MAG: response regulator transcription factor [Planctomycetota bacterium]
MTKTVLLIDDEPDLVRLLDYNLTQAGYAVLSARDGASGLDLAARHAPDVVVLDVMMPGMEGWEVCRRLRASSTNPRVPILILTAKTEEADRVLGLELGADDYLTKPFSVREVVARVRALLRRAEPPVDAEEVLRLGKLVIDSGRWEAMISGKAVPLTTTEFQILRALARRPGRVLSREELISQSHAQEVAVIDRTIDVHVASLRRKLGRQGDRLETVRGIGYRIRE